MEKLKRNWDSSKINYIIYCKYIVLLLLLTREFDFSHPDEWWIAWRWSISVDINIVQMDS